MTNYIQPSDRESHRVQVKLRHMGFTMGFADCGRIKGNRMVEYNRREGDVCFSVQLWAMGPWRASFGVGGREFAPPIEFPKNEADYVPKIVEQLRAQAVAAILKGEANGVVFR